MRRTTGRRGLLMWRLQTQLRTPTTTSICGGFIRSGTSICLRCTKTIRTGLGEPALSRTNTLKTVSRAFMQLPTVTLICTISSNPQIQARVLLHANVSLSAARYPRRLRLHSQEEQQKHLLRHFDIMTKTHVPIKITDWSKTHEAAEDNITSRHCRQSLRTKDKSWSRGRWQQQPNGDQQ